MEHVNVGDEARHTLTGRRALVVKRDTDWIRLVQDQGPGWWDKDKHWEKTECRKTQ